MKAIFRIPAKEQYGYVELEVEVPSPESALEQYEEIIKFYKGSNVGLPVPEFNKALDRYLSERTMDSNVYLAMDSVQQMVCQEIKKSFKRINK